MRTNGFALFIGPDSVSLAEKASARVSRRCVERDILGVGGIPGIAGLVEDASLLSYTLDKEQSAQVVHGFTENNHKGRGHGASGEYALLQREDDELVARRDPLGTRPLYTNESGSIVGSDHGFFGDRARLVPNGGGIVLSPKGPGVAATRALSPGGAGASLEDCAKELASLLRRSVEARIEGRKKVAVSFSGGLDSSLVALIAARSAKVVLCSAYTKGSRDEVHAKAAAETLGLELAATEIDAGRAAQELRELDLPFDATPMDRALWCIYSVTAREAASRGAELIMLGQLADELFGGYMKYARAARESEEEARRMMLADIAASGERAFVRDEKACSRFSEVRFPFADERLAEFAIGLPVGYKIRGDERKVILRRAASVLGLPESLVEAPKKAAQYSSGVGKLVS